MADFTAIAAATRTIRRLLIDRMETAGVAVTTSPPDVTVANINGPRVNFYLYEVHEHPQMKNQPIPGREHPAAFGHPPLSLTLRYLMTSHARSEDQFDSDIIAQTLLGDAMLVLHDLGGRMDDLRLVTNRAGAIGDPVLDVILREEFERVKLVLHPAQMEDLSKLWSAMPQANFRRSAVYEASLVQIEGRLPRRRPAPVQTRRIMAIVSRAPTLLAAYATPPPPPSDTLRDLRISVGGAITLEHSPTTCERLYVRFGKLEPIRVPLPSSGIIRINVPDDQYPIDLDHPALRPIPIDVQLQPGPLEVQLLAVAETEGVQGGLDRGTPLVVDRAQRSNTALLQLTPSVTLVNPTFGTAAAIVQVTGTRLWSETAPSELVFGDAAVPIRPPQPGDPWAAPTPTHVEVPASAVSAVLAPRPTPYSLAAQVNGVRSRETAFDFRLDP
ncbi:MAG: DUF4255 domain-containing protein [Inquilinus sp.]|uniref:DUF4255 domain-containing protein n=1 Tax=Inquilinus sp. TaxID=1932117 RepID=UPI003F33795B